MVYKIKVKGYEFLSKVLEHDIENDYRETEDKNKVYYYASDYKQIKKLFHRHKKDYKKHKCVKMSEEELAEVGPRGGIRPSKKAPKSDTPNRSPKGNLKT